MGDGTIGSGRSRVGLLRDDVREEAKQRSDEEMEMEGTHFDGKWGKFSDGVSSKTVFI